MMDEYGFDVGSPAANFMCRPLGWRDVLAIPIYFVFPFFISARMHSLSKLKKRVPLPKASVVSRRKLLKDKNEKD